MNQDPDKRVLSSATDSTELVYGKSLVIQVKAVATSYLKSRLQRGDRPYVTVGTVDTINRIGYCQAVSQPGAQDEEKERHGYAENAQDGGTRQ
jgi:hypothetical protein